MFMTSQSNGFGKANDRFNAPTKHKVQPSPNSYSPKLEVDARQRSPVIAKFGMNTVDILESQWGVKSHKKMPGPGSYETITEF